MKIGDIVNIPNSSSGYWKGKITDVSDEWTLILKTGKVLQRRYSGPIVTVKEIGGNGHAVLHVGQLEAKDGEYYERRKGSR